MALGARLRGAPEQSADGADHRLDVERADAGEVRTRLLSLCRTLGALRPHVLTEQLIVLMDGVYAYPESFADSAASSAVIEAADALVKVQLPERRAGRRPIERK